MSGQGVKTKSLFNSVDSDFQTSTVDNLNITGSIDLSLANVTGITTDYVSEASNKYYLDSRVSNNSDVSANTTHRGIVTGNPHNVSASDVGISDIGSTAIISNSERTKIGYITVTQGVDLDTLENNVTINNAKNTYPTGDATKVGFITVTDDVNLDTIKSNVEANNAKITYPSSDSTKVGFITVTQNVDLDTLENDVTTNNAKITYPSIDSTKVGFITVTAAVDLDTIKSNVDTNNAKITYPSSDSTKVGFITVTQNVDLDTLENDVATNNAKISYPSSDSTKVGYLTVTNPINLDDVEIYDQSLNTTNDVEFNSVNTDVISEKTSGAGISFGIGGASSVDMSGNFFASSYNGASFVASSEVQSDIIAEKTLNSGVSIDGVLMKDGEVDGVDISSLETTVNLNTAKNTYPSSDSTKVGFLTVTSPIDLDNVEIFDQSLNTTNDVEFNSVNGFDVSTIAPTSTSDNLLLSSSAPSLSTGNYNIGIGRNSMPNVSDSNYCVVVGNAAFGGSGDSCTMIGYYSGGSSGTGDDNTFIGARSADNSIGTASNCVSIGANTTILTNVNNQIAIGHGASCDSANQCTIGNSSINVIRSGANNVCDLGSSSRSFKNLYLSGTILGNGLFPTSFYTPSATDSLGRGFTVNVANGNYFQIGTKVFVQVNFAWVGKGTTSGRIRFSLPIASLAPVPVTLTVGYHYGITFDSQLVAVGAGGNDYFELFSSTSGSSTTPLNTTHYNTSGQIQVQGFYSTA